jgi:hypothetical protein
MHSYQRVAVKGRLDIRVVKPVFKIRHKQAEDRRLSEGRQAQWIFFHLRLRRRGGKVYLLELR